MENMTGRGMAQILKADPGIGRLNCEFAYGLVWGRMGFHLPE
jgi:hypothetical protein